MPRDEETLFQNMSRLVQAGIDPVSRHREIWDRYGATAAALVLDSSGFSRVTESHGIVHFLSRLMLLRNIVKPVCEDHHCKHLNFNADNAFAYFDSVDDAICTARELHRNIYQSGLMLTEEERFQVSIGIGYGEMLYSETLEGYFSEEVNFASKLGEDLACGDETRLTVNAYGNAEPHLVQGFTLQQVEISGVTIHHYLQSFTPPDLPSGS